MATIADPRDILISPVISEKSYKLLDENKYTFVVRPDANKTQIKIAVAEVCESVSKSRLLRAVVAQVLPTS